MNNNILFETGDYTVLITDNHYEKEQGLTRGYGVYNSKTKVQEVSSTVLFEAIRWARSLDASLKAVLAKEPEQMEILWPEGPTH